MTYNFQPYLQMHGGWVLGAIQREYIYISTYVASQYSCWLMVRMSHKWIWCQSTRYILFLIIWFWIFYCPTYDLKYWMAFLIVRGYMDGQKLSSIDRRNLFPRMRVAWIQNIIFSLWILSCDDFVALVVLAIFGCSLLES